MEEEAIDNKIGSDCSSLPLLVTAKNQKKFKCESTAYVNKISWFRQSQMIFQVHVHEEEKGTSQSNEALALGRLGLVSCKVWAAVSRSHRGQEVDSGGIPYEPQGPAVDNRVWGRGALGAGDQT